LLSEQEEVRRRVMGNKGYFLFSLHVCERVDEREGQLGLKKAFNSVKIGSIEFYL